MKKLLTSFALLGALLAPMAAQADDDDDALLGAALALGLGVNVAGYDDDRDVYHHYDRRPANHYYHQQPRNGYWYRHSQSAFRNNNHDYFWHGGNHWDRRHQCDDRRHWNHGRHNGWNNGRHNGWNNNWNDNNRWRHHDDD